MKTCNKCGVSRTTSEFSIRTGTKNLMPVCKPCNTEYQRKKRQTRDPKEVRQYHRSWYKQNSESVLKKARRYYRKNKAQIRAKSKIKYRKNPLRGFESNLRRKYGLSLAEYNKMVASQCGVCAICGQTNKFGKRLAVDHDHKTGKVRELLCGFCNTALGSLKESLTTLERMAEYIKKHS